MRVYDLHYGDRIRVDGETVTFIRMEGMTAKCKTKRRSLMHLYATMKLTQVGDEYFPVSDG